MKKYLLLLLILVFSIQAQDSNESKPYAIVRSNLGSSGSSHVITTSKGKYSISQSIGQSSVIGTHFSNGYYLRQGYQQPLNKISVIKELNGSLNALVFPNPFEESVLFLLKKRF